MDRITNLKQNVNKCNERLMLVPDMHDVQPEDSVSGVGLRQKSHAWNISQRSMAGSNISGTSSSSSISLSKVKAASKKVRLQAQAASFRKKAIFARGTISFTKIGRRIQIVIVLDPIILFCILRGREGVDEKLLIDER